MLGSILGYGPDDRDQARILGAIAPRAELWSCEWAVWGSKYDSCQGGSSLMSSLMQARCHSQVWLAGVCVE